MKFLKVYIEIFFIFSFLINILLLCVGWLEPLIDPIAKNPNVSSVPVIETIDYIDFSVSNSSIDQILVGGFNWNLVFD